MARNKPSIKTAKSKSDKRKQFTYEGSKGQKLVMENRLKSSKYDSKNNRWRFQAELTIEYEAEGIKRFLAEEFERVQRNVLAKEGLENVSFDKMWLWDVVSFKDYHRLLQETTLEIIEDVFQPVHVTAYAFLVSTAALLASPLVDRRLAADCQNGGFREHMKVMEGYMPSASELEKRIGWFFRRILKEHFKPYLRTAGRKYGTGSFRSSITSLRALADVLGQASKKPSQWETMYRLSRHPLWRGRELDKAHCQKQTKTLRNWLEKAGIKDWEEALEKYYTPARSGK